ncbi:D-aminoacyl-tRNA deacylase [Nesterenkonia xinjiangensis]|uniref:D-aminoacyl-tRNA deacylase n=1 Tax=Nesterenkonia xinjiangensis TaxID=225327 RepID=A0A7Z0KA64_9MICC|nr:D-aminoacyl-tRNA deacylase [Nesterenkonia xinjiangensis]NYJ79459.1 D-tyrosyl-tRNA(Tyr) deacylase [Nesterenkonia xinjiangensis]
MRAVIQRVSRAQVRAELAQGGSHVSGFDGEGLVVLLGVTHGDTEQEARLLAEKTWRLRILADERSAEQAGAPVLAVSQFTLYGDARKGRRPSWSRAAPAEVGEPVCRDYVWFLRELGAEVLTGVFGAAMEVELVNDGPVTLILDTEELRRPRRS